MKYRQLARRLRFSVPGQPDVVSVRPRDERTHEYTDEPHGTVVDIPKGAVGVDVEMLLRTGALAEIPVAAAGPSPQPSPRGRGSALKESGSG